MALIVSLALVGATWSTGRAAPPPAPPGGDDGLAVYTGVVDADALAAITGLGVDRHELQVSPVDTDAGLFEVEVILSGEQASALVAEGAELAPQASANRRLAVEQDGVFRRYSGPGGLQEELLAQAAAHPAIARAETIGQTTNGQDITAVRVTKDVARTRAGRRPTTVYIAAQHAREWITPEMVRRLLDHILTGYGTDARITQLIDENELWFVPVANPDGYDYTHDVERLWRKNLRDNNGDGVITPGDGVDLNRNFSTRWGYDNEGSSPNPASETYRGPDALSEPEDQALDDLFARITPEFMINYHSAAELLLYGLGWQVSTPSPDDVIYEAMAGDDVIGSAIPGYDPDISAELYTTNGDTDSHMQEVYGTLGFTPEMSTCETASAKYDDDAFEPEDCESGFNFPDDERLIQEEFTTNIPFALAVAESAADPDDPVSVLGIDTPTFVVDSFAVSSGDPQTVAVTAKRDVAGLRMKYRINGGHERTTQAREWAGGERYGFENVDYYAEFRGVVRGAAAGDEVEVWFTGTAQDRDERGRVESEHFTYTVASDSGSRVLIVANEDYTGVNPTFPSPPGGGPKYVDEHVAAFQANGITPDVWDVDTQGIPHDLGVLSHYDVVLWYLGDNRLTQDADDYITELPYFGPNVGLEDTSVAERTQYLTLAMRDHLNAGGKLIHAGETAAMDSLLDDELGGLIGGLYYGLDDAPEQQCVVVDDLLGDCLLLADDFAQYWLGAYDHEPLAGAEGVVGTAGPLDGDQATFGGPATVANPIDEVGAFTVTSDLLPVEQFPQFASSAVIDYTGVVGAVTAVEGELAAVANHADESYMRLGRVIDLTAVAASEQPRLDAQLGWSTEPGYDHVIVEAHVVGDDDWTTLADVNGNTSTDVPAECEAGFFIGLHPNLSRYLTLGDACEPAFPGSWNSFTGDSGGFVPVAFDLTAYAGQQVEVVVSYVTDPSTGSTGAILDDTRVVTTAGVVEAEGFEGGFGGWQVLGPPEGSGANARDWTVAHQLGDITAGVATEDTLLFGFGIEQLESSAARAELVADALELLFG
ncbi:MAG: M14 family zinc carboxypeptidase [Ilumatobacteraceae bacterium]